MKTWALSGSIVALLCLVPTARAAGADDADALIQKGTELRRQGQDVEALAVFQRALSLRASPRAAAQVALAEQALGLWVEANTHLSQALQNRDDAWIKKNHAALDSALSTIQGHLCRIELWGAPAGAEIQIDGKHAGNLPRVQTWVAPGEISFEAKAEGYLPSRRTLKTSEGAIVREHIELRAGPASVPVADAPAAAAVAPAPPLPPAPPPVESAALVTPAADTNATPAQGESRLRDRWWVWTLVGVAVVGAGVTAAVLLSHRNEAPSCDSASCSTWN